MTQDDAMHDRRLRETMSVRQTIDWSAMGRGRRGGEGEIAWTMTDGP